MKQIGIVLLLVVASSSFAARKNCKLVVRTLGTDGKAKVEVIETEALSRDDCKRQAKEKETITNNELTSNIRASYSFREFVE